MFTSISSPFKEDTRSSDIAADQYPLLVIHKDKSTQTVYSGYSSSIIFRIHPGIILLITILLYFAFCVLMMCSSYMQSNFVYSNFIRYPPGDLSDMQNFGLSQARYITLFTQDGLKLSGWHLLPPGPQAIFASGLNFTAKELYFDSKLKSAERIIIFFHGSAATRGTWNRVNMIKQLSATLSTHVIVIDYRGFGDSEGWPTEQGTLIDTLATLEWLTNRTHSDNNNKQLECDVENNTDQSNITMKKHSPAIYVYGQSLGTAISIALIAELEKTGRSNIIRGLILDSSFTTLADAASTHPAGAIFRIFPFIQNLMLKHLKFYYRSIETITAIKTTPVLFLHGQQDFMVPIQQGRLLYETLLTSRRKDSKHFNAELVRFVEVPWAGHINVYKSYLWMSELPKFIQYLENM